MARCPARGNRIQQTPSGAVNLVGAPFNQIVVGQVSACHGSHVVGLGCARSYKVFNAVTWDPFMAAQHQEKGLGSEVLAKLLRHRLLAKAERVSMKKPYNAGYYTKVMFLEHHAQKLLIRESEHPMADTRTQ
jgi:hypothetical protein